MRSPPPQSPPVRHRRRRHYSGNATSHFGGLIDDIWLSSVARYTADCSDPARDLAGDADPVWHFDMQTALGPWLIASNRETCAVRRKGDATLPVE